MKKTGWIIPVVAIVGLIHWLWGAQIWSNLTGHNRGAWFIVALIFGGIITASVGFSVYDTKQSGLAANVGVFGVILVIVGFGGMIFSGYHIDRAYLVGMEETQQNDVNYLQRTPYDIAVATSSRNMQNTNGTLGDVKFIADNEDNGTWGAPVIRRGFVQGYESVQTSELPLFGTAKSTDTVFCEFADHATLRLGGAMPKNNLGRAILSKTGLGISFTDSDSYTYCEGETPLVIVPLKKTSGLFHPTSTPYGIAVYNGTTSELKIVTNIDEINEYKGSTYPLSLAERQRAALKATGGYWDKVFSRSGWETSANDENDPNVNVSEIQLRRAEGGIDYVTPLTPVGDSTSIVGVSTVEARITTPGTRNPLQVNVYPNGETRIANSATSDAIKTQYSSLSDWANGMDVFEIVPSSDNLWEASIGKQQSVVYRATITRSGEIKLYRADGTIVGETQVNISEGDNDVDVTVVVPPSGEFNEMTTQELVELSQLIAEELGNRAGS